MKEKMPPFLLFFFGDLVKSAVPFVVYAIPDGSRGADFGNHTPVRNCRRNASASHTSGRGRNASSILK